ncbi:hypothetical protein [Priestia taiwanensis]|uniref:hypothetical protein n=1 Tax=Priestia taiwanensis TaxID=1347902 RepID=UPI0016678009|nr:hypothetical protein [Priestia taiwanensis]MBM7362452.1 hypothetical protein [Priestia taiwanensis]
MIFLLLLVVTSGLLYSYVFDISYTKGWIFVSWIPAIFVLVLLLPFILFLHPSIEENQFASR